MSDTTGSAPPAEKPPRSRPRQMPMNRPFRDRTLAEAEGVNPHVALHRELPEVIPAEDAERWRGRWVEAFDTPGPLHLEIGSGNGFYLSGMAAQEPDLRWLGLELRFKRVVIAARKLQAAKLTNARLVRFDAFNLARVFAEGELSGVHINHPDPWAKDRQAHRRLISEPVLTQLASYVRPGGELRLKTDFYPHVEALLAYVASPAGAPWTVLGTSHDILHDGAPWANDVCTNYQRKFNEKGLPVYAARLRRAAVPRPAEGG